MSTVRKLTNKSLKQKCERYDKYEWYDKKGDLCKILSPKEYSSNEDKKQKQIFLCFSRNFII